MKRTKILTTICLVFTLCLIPVLAVLIFALPPLLRYYIDYHPARIINLILTAFYICVPAGFFALGLLSKVLANIRRDTIFTMQNVNCFRLLSICALYVGVVCFVTGLSYLPLFLMAMTALFIGLLLQVLVRLLKTACEIAEENSLTI